MPVPRLIVLTNAKPGEAATEYLTDRDRFPAEALFTTDLAKARTWGYPPGVRRWVKRNLPVLPMLNDCRRVWVNEDLVVLARQADGAAAAPPEPRHAKPAGHGKGRRAAKLNPNKRPRRAAGKPRKPAAAKRSTPRTGRKPHRPAKAA